MRASPRYLCMTPSFICGRKAMVHEDGTRLILTNRAILKSGLCLAAALIFLATAAYEHWIWRGVTTSSAIDVPGVMLLAVILLPAAAFLYLAYVLYQWRPRLTIDRHMDRASLNGPLGNDTCWTCRVAELRFQQVELRTHHGRYVWALAVRPDGDDGRGLRFRPFILQTAFLKKSIDQAAIEWGARLDLEVDLKPGGSVYTWF